MEMSYDFAVFIARMQPPHQAHIKILEKALKTANRVIVILGSHRKAANLENPWTSEQREQMVRICFPEAKDRLAFIPVRDHPYDNDAWLVEVQQKVKTLTEGSRSVVLIGHDKDKTSFYLKMFPQWKFVEVGQIDDDLSATMIRDSYFGENLWLEGDAPAVDFDWRNSVASSVQIWLEEFRMTADFTNLLSEYEENHNYRQRWKGTPFPVIFSTVDTVVVKSGHILLIRRRVAPGKGKLALPGGFVNQEEWLFDSAVRELKEETRIKLDQRYLKDMVADQRTFDHPRRSTRGRTITHAFYIPLPSVIPPHGNELPEVRGDDDAERAMWIPLSDLRDREDELFEDHFSIIQHFVGKL